MLRFLKKIRNGFLQKPFLILCFCPTFKSGKGEKSDLFAFPVLGLLYLYNGYRYGVPSYVIDASDVYVIDPAGVRYMKERYRGPKGIVIIGIDCKDRAERMRRRGDSEAAVGSRLHTDHTEFAGLPAMADVLFKNEDLDQTVRAIYAFIRVMEGEL